MRIYVTTVFLVLAFNLFGQTKAEKRFLKTIINTLDTKDFGKVKTLFPSDSIWSQFEQMTNQVFPESFTYAFNEERRIEFDKILRQTQRYNIDWEKFKVDKFEFEKKNLHDSKVIGITGHLFVKHKKRTVTLMEVSIMELNSAYYLVGIRNIVNSKMWTPKGNM